MTTPDERAARRRAWHEAHPVVKAPPPARRPIDWPDTPATQPEKRTKPSILALPLLPPFYMLEWLAELLADPPWSRRKPGVCLTYHPILDKFQPDDEDQASE